MAQWHGKDDRVRLASISSGADFVIDLARCAEAAFAYVDDVGCGVQILDGLALDGRITIPDRPRFMWLDGPRDCVLLRPTDDGMKSGRASFRSLGVGEFCVEIYLVRSDGSTELIHENDFCLMHSAHVDEVRHARGGGGRWRSGWRAPDQGAAGGMAPVPGPTHRTDP